MRTLFFLLCLTLNSWLNAQIYTVVADSLRLPNGLEFDASGRLWVVETGYGFDDGAVSVQGPNGELLPVVVGLPSLFDTISQENVGPWHTLQLPNNKLGVVSPLDGGVLIFDLNGFVPGQSQPLSPAQAVSKVIIADFVFQNQPPGMGDTDPYTAVVDAGGNWYVADAGFNGIIKVAPNGDRSIFCKFDAITNPLPVGPPVIDAVPTRIIAKPGGGFYVCELSGFPFPQGSASVLEVNANGVVSSFATGFTMLTDMSQNAVTGDIYLLEFGVFDLNIFNFAPNSGKVWRLKPDGSRLLLAEGLNLAPGLATDTQGDIYVSELATGRVLRFNGISGTNEADQDLSNFLISPNPASDQVHIQYELQERGPVSFQVLDATGKLVFTQNQGLQESGPQSFNWHPNQLNAGIYWVDIRTKNGIQTQRLILH